MTDVHALPAPIVAYDWDGVDTSIDAETPRLLSDEQFDRYAETVAALLTAAGLDVRTPNEGAPSTLEIHNRRTGHTVELDMRDDRSAEWSLSAGDEIPEDTPALDLAAQIARLLCASGPATR
ncbi:hypothetical protein HDA32_003975 [Spinactinospora alkalitolerans]|uniref:Uncharacterized protein n=1 Tax=Spinactinospora alkalitolerans TaxID=687207 RepID=A0A852TZW9_9ACTN|nr:hypothetical protein [Spinactinospora alkalitolerans]NYE48855.1 hypothetical protein [Spinactinospora alkalitolerans]